MKPSKLLAMSNYETENRAIDYVIAQEKAARREARRVPGSPVDLESIDHVTGEKRLIEVKAFGGSGRGDFLWLEPNQVAALSEVPGSHLYIVTDVRSTDPSTIRILDLTGDQLREGLAAKKEKRYFEVPLPVALYDELRAAAGEPPAEE